MGSSVTVKVNTNQVNKALKEVSKRVERVSLERLKEAAEAGARAATEGYAKAIYAGNLDAVVSVEQTEKRTYSIIATGQCVKFIEYGTGVFNPKSKWNERGYWFFTGDGPNFVNTAKASKVKNIYYRTTEAGGQWEDEFVANINGYEFALEEEDLENLDEDFEGNLTWFSEKDEEYYPVTKQRKLKDFQEDAETRRKVPEYRVDKGPRENSHSYITGGNPPNHVMRHAKNVMLRQFYSKYKTKYSRFEE